MKVALCPLRRNVVSANAPSPSGAGSATCESVERSSISIATTRTSREQIYRDERSCPDSAIQNLTPANGSGVRGVAQVDAVRTPRPVQRETPAAGRRKVDDRRSGAALEDPAD